MTMRILLLLIVTTTGDDRDVPIQLHGIMLPNHTLDDGGDRCFSRRGVLGTKFQFLRHGGLFDGVLGGTGYGQIQPFRVDIATLFGCTKA